MKLIILEIASYVFIVGVWCFFRWIIKRNITGDMLVGTVFGFFNEFAAEPLTNYYFAFNIYKDIPVIVPIAWGMMFGMAVFVSEKMYLFFTKGSRIKPGDKRILIFDVAAGILCGFPLEIFGHWMGAWEYNYHVVNWDMIKIPIVNMPLEALMAYCLLMLIGPTIVRYWEGSFEGRL